MFYTQKMFCSSALLLLPLYFIESIIAKVIMNGLETKIIFAGKNDDYLDNLF